jgi:subtilisin family serine protease
MRFSPLGRPRVILVRALLFVAIGGGLLSWGKPPEPCLPQISRAPVVEEATPDSGAPALSGPAAIARAQHLTGLGVERWHRAGFRGQGIKIAILDSGFRGYRDFLGSALPAKVTTKSFRPDGNLESKDSQHGILCAEVIHALAPEAELLLANWEADNPDSYLAAVRWAKEQGARLISCSVIMPSWSDGEGGGPVNAALAKLLGTGKANADVLCFACAGNTAQRHWSGSFSPDHKGFHQWSAGQTSNRLRPWGQDRVAVELYGPTQSAGELQVTDAQTGSLVGRSKIKKSQESSSPWSCAVVRFQAQPGRSYEVRLTVGQVSEPAGEERQVWKPAPQKEDRFHLVALGGSLQTATASGSIPFPGDGPGVQVVGAVDGDGQRLSYSSCGPNTSQPKPDFVAPVPFPSSWRERPFAGTSAAAPQAAGLAALWWSRHPRATPEEVSLGLRTASRDLGPPGHDCETGYGQIRLP